MGRKGRVVCRLSDLVEGRGRLVRLAGREIALFRLGDRVLARSRCRGAGAKLWCGTCHNPHRPAASFREKCLGCHETEQCTSPRRASQDCMACHMPKARAWDGGHTVFTDHSIPRRPARPGGRPGAPADIVPYYRRELPRWLAARNLGLAYCELAARYRDSALYEKAWPLLREAVQAGPGDAALYGQVAQLFEATGRVAEAIDFYRRSLNFDPDQPPMLVGLARLLANRGEKQEARTLYQRALRMNPRLKAER